MNILIAAYSAQQYADRRALCWQTWFSQVHNHPQLDRIFVYGSDPPRTQIAPDYWVLPSKPDYPSLPWRTYQLFETALTIRGWDYLFKCDDDTYIHPQRFADFDPSPHPFLGVQWNRMGYYSGGEGYYVSREAAAACLPHYRRHLDQARTDAEDMMTGWAMRDCGYPLPDLPNVFRKFNDPNVWPSSQNQIMVCHMKHTTRGHVTRHWQETMLAIHEQFYPLNTDPVPEHLLCPQP